MKVVHPQLPIVGSLFGSKRAALVLGLLAAGSALPAHAATPSYLPFGPQTNVSESSVTGGGWTQCYSDRFNTTLNPSTVLSQCSGDQLMMACRPVGSATLSLLAQSTRADVTFDTGNNLGTTHNSNGTEWYYNVSGKNSWGFAGSGDSVNKNSCDTNGTNPSSRMCIHTNGGGYRCGATTGLNGSTTWERVFYVPGGTFVPPFAYQPYVAGVGAPTALDMTAGNGPALTACLLPALQQLLGGSIGLGGQSRTGVSTFSWNGQTVAYFPLAASAANSISPALQLPGSNLLSVVTTCGTLSTAPAPFNLELFGAAFNAKGMYPSINENGVIAWRSNGTVMVARPEYTVSAGTPYAAGITVNRDGSYRFTDTQGNSQLLRPAFLDLQALSNAVGGAISVQVDGTIIQTIGASRFQLVADQNLSSVPADHAIDLSAWSDGTNHFSYRIQNVKPFPTDLFQFTYAQGFTRISLP